MNKLHAYDIALIPPKEVLKQCIKMNQSIQGRENIDFKRHGQLPHITLLMGGVFVEDLVGIKSKLIESMAEMEPIKIILTGTYAIKRSIGIQVELTNQLSKFHAQIIEEFGNLFKKSITEANVTGLPNVSAGTVEFINNYQKNSILDNYFPHITIGELAQIKSTMSFPLIFNTKDIRIAPMGDHCTFIDKY